jgi:hypothetical protein
MVSRGVVGERPILAMITPLVTLAFECDGVRLSRKRGDVEPSSGAGDRTLLLSTSISVRSAASAALIVSMVRPVGLSS